MAGQIGSKKEVVCHGLCEVGRFVCNEYVVIHAKYTEIMNLFEVVWYYFSSITG